MSSERIPIPAALERALMIEAGYRCAIPTCRTSQPLEIEHIDDYAKVKEHTFENMIVLCRNCHGMKGSGPRSLDRKALKQLKANLGHINHRYNDTERRILEHFARNPDEKTVMLPGTPVLYGYLVHDGIIAAVDSGYSVLAADDKDDYLIQGYELTELGNEMVLKLRENQGLG